MLLVSYLSAIVSGLASAFSTSYIMFSVMRFLTGLTITGIAIISMVLCVEWVDIEHRTFIGVFVSMDWTLSSMMLSGVAYLVNDWRWLVVTVTSPLLLAVITWWWVPESARWLIANGQLEKAHVYLEKCARMNNRRNFMTDIKPESLANVVVVERGNRNYSYLDLVKTPKMRKLALLTGTVWYGVALTYYGISLNITGFGLNIYLTQFIYGAIEMPAKILIYYSLDSIGRRQSQVGTLVLTGVCIAINLLIPKDMWMFRTIIAVLGKGFSEASFTTIYLYTAEIYPTVLRQNGLGYNSFVARLGVSISPLIILLEDVWSPLPKVIFCAVALFSGMVTSFLPETLNVRLPETIEDIEQTRKRSVCMLSQRDEFLLTGT
ncbi:hypothetical protein AAFF_G00198690 [Aldrovandia affinis]|uniref:Major facilitator superfamily (MFS) profile domain-containing protein n=1 Tax=Aldrovandia affinis TaxID=143900 RepID=A0AAD7RIH5_9TELE|nr:hypothetical protein AAFF_G00198690 [Aldrovandia affinis]